MPREMKFHKKFIFKSDNNKTSKSPLKHTHT